MPLFTRSCVLLLGLWVGHFEGRTYEPGTRVCACVRMSDLAFWCFYGSCKLRHAPVSMTIMGASEKGRRGGCGYACDCIESMQQMLMGNSVCVSPTTRGSFTVLAGELNDIPPRTIHSRPPISPLPGDSSLGQRFPPLPRLSWSPGTTHTEGGEWVSGFSDFWSLPWIITQRLRGMKLAGSVWNMAAVLFAVIYGGSAASHATLLRLHFISQHRNYCACLCRGERGAEVITI